MIDARGERGTVKRPRRILLDAPARRQPLLSSEWSKGDGNCISSTVRTTSFVNAPVQQPFAASTVAQADTLSQSSVSSVCGSMGKRRKGLLNTPAKAKGKGALAEPTTCAACCSKLRINDRGEHCCSRCGKIQSRSSARVDSLVGAPLRKAPAEVDHAKAHRDPSNDRGVAKKLPALLDLPSNMYQLQAVQAPVPLNSLSALMPATSAVPTSLFDLMARHRRPFYPSSASEEKRAQPQSLFAAAACSCAASESSDHCTARHHPFSRAEFVRGVDLKLANDNKAGTGSSRSKKRSRSKRAHKATMTDVREEGDLQRLCQLRADVDRRIAQLKNEKEPPGSDAQGIDSITYVSGYYCHVCQRLLGEDRKSASAHGLDAAHLARLENNDKEESVVQDSDSVFKYYEEKYDCIAFDDSDVKTAEQSEPSDCQLTRQEPNEEAPPVEVSPTSSSHDGKSCDGMETDGSYDECNSPAECPPCAVDDDEEPEETPARERFDRTKTSR